MPRTALDDRDRELLQAKNFCHVSVPREDGTIQSVPVWVDTDGERIVLNSAEGRASPANLRRNRRATLLVMNMENPYEYVSVSGALAEEDHAGADEHIDAMAKKYLGQDSYPFRQEGEQRVIFKIAPEQVRRRGS